MHNIMAQVTQKKPTGSIALVEGGWRVWDSLPLPLAFNTPRETADKPGWDGL